MTENKDISHSKDKIEKSKIVYVESLGMEMEYMDFLNLLCDPLEFERIRKERNNKKKED